MSRLLAGSLEDTGSHLINSVGNIDVGKENVNGIISNLTILSIFLTTFRHNVVKGRSSFDRFYDYIIIGGGTAGSIMASRLSQHPCIKVLLLEAGGEQPILTDVPGFARGFLGTDIDWSYKTVPQANSSFGQKENRVLWNSGKVLGGGSVLNAMLYVRGNKQNFDQWAAEGATGWSYKDVFPYFLKLEDNRNTRGLDPGYHARGGPIGAERSNYNPVLKQRVLQALTGLGFPLRDINGARQFGVYDLQGTVRNQERCSTTRGYLKPSSRRRNLHIVTRAFVRNIIIQKTGPNQHRAVAVVFDHGNKTHVVQIQRSSYIRDGIGEVILSNGAVRTPQTLMLSGIGPKEQLRKFGIPLVADLPVGKNLMDHNSAALLYEVDPLLVNAFTKELTPENMIEYLLFRRGPLTSISQVMVMAFLDGLRNKTLPNDFPMQQIYFLDYNTEDAVRTLNLRKEVEEKVFTPYLLRPVLLCFAQLLQPFSRGEITLNSLDPHQFPNINPRYYSDPRDEYYVVGAMKICNAVSRHPAMQKLKTKWVDAQSHGYPGCESLEGNEDKYLYCIARSVVNTIWHPTGTARMGSPSDPRSVVDPQLRVIGVDKLRVVNAAIMPIITSGNTNVPTMMIAEKAYDMMQKDILCPSSVTIKRNHQVPIRN